jgi:hypothetical protein
MGEKVNTVEERERETDRQTETEGKKKGDQGDIIIPTFAEHYNTITTTFCPSTFSTALTPSIT